MAQIALGVLSPWPLKLVVDNVLGGEALPFFLSWPTILIVDEPTSSLDTISQASVLNEGRISAQGTVDELLESSELYRRMCARLSVGRSLDDPETVDELLQAG